MAVTFQDILHRLQCNNIFLELQQAIKQMIQNLKNGDDGLI